MNEELFAEMQALGELDPSGTTEEQEDRLSVLLELHDAGEAYLAEA